MDDITLLYGDCIDLLKEIADESVDCVITDPPYCLGVSSNGTKSSMFDNRMVIPFFERLFEEYRRVLKDGAPLYINTDWRTYPLQYDAFCRCFSMRNLIVWDYMWLKAGTYYRFTHEFIMYGTKGKRKRRFDAAQTDIWRVRCINYTDVKNKLHQAQKPIELIQRMLLNDTDKGDLVLDSFMGSGSTGVACLQEGRRFIGIELDPKYFEVAKRRIEEAQKGLFV